MSMVSYEQRGGVACIMLDNPQQLNAMAGTMCDELMAVFNRIEKDASVRATLLTGAGRGFCSGANLAGDELMRDAENMGEAMGSSFNALFEDMRRLSKPIVTAVNGPAAGAGVGLALAGDIVLAAQSAKFVLTFARLGLVLDGGVSLFVQRAVGAQRARAMAMLGEAVDAQTAERWGLVWRTYPDKELMAAAWTTAERLASGPPVALGLIKRQLEQSWRQDIAEALRAEAQFQGEVFLTKDAAEGIAAYQERRPARFNGS